MFKGAIAVHKFIVSLITLIVLLTSHSAYAQAGNYQGTVEAKYTELAEVAFGSVTGSYVIALTNTNKDPLRLVHVTNDLNVGLYVSFNGTVNHVFVAAGKTVMLGLGDIALHETGNIYIKYSSAPASGSVYIGGAY